VDKYAPDSGHLLCGNPAAAVAVQTFLLDWREQLLASRQQPAAAEAAGGVGAAAARAGAAGGRATGGRAAVSESDNSWSMGGWRDEVSNDSFGPNQAAPVR
jgi:hypothetical protein